MLYGTHDLLYLVDGGGPREQGFPQQHLSQDTAKTPHVHTFSVPVDKMSSFYSLVHSYLIFQRSILSFELKCCVNAVLSSSSLLNQLLWGTSTSSRCGTYTDNRCSSQLIPCGSQQDLGSSVPTRRHVLRQCWIPTVLLDLVKWSGQAEITQLDYTVSVQQHIGWLWETQTKRNILYKDNNSLIFTHLQRGQEQGMKTEIIQGVERGETAEKLEKRRDEILFSRVRGHFVWTCQQISCRLVQVLLNVIK